MLQLPAGREASQGVGGFRYERHRPEQTLLYQLVEQYYPALTDSYLQICPVSQREGRNNYIGKGTEESPIKPR